MQSMTCNTCVFWRECTAEGHGAAASKRRRCRAMLDITTKLLLLIDAMCCHLHAMIVGSVS